MKRVLKYIFRVLLFPIYLVLVLAVLLIMVLITPLDLFYGEACGKALHHALEGKE